MREGGAASFRLGRDYIGNCWRHRSVFYVRTWDQPCGARYKGKFQNVWEKVCWKMTWLKPDNLTSDRGRCLPIERGQFAMKFLRCKHVWLVPRDLLVCCMKNW
ncbi:uncharacterized protein AAG666_023784 isoform 1-T1 [Megaptera novaeangliae]